MKTANKKQPKKKVHIKPAVEKHIAEERYSDKEGMPTEDRPYADYPFGESKETDEMKKEEEEEYELYYTG
jgi:hypothetical protein